MKPLIEIDGRPRSGTFWWIAKLSGTRPDEAEPAGNVLPVPSSGRGSGWETAVLAGLYGAAFLGVVHEVLRRWAGDWSWLLLIPVAFVALHMCGVGVALVGDGLAKIGVLRRGIRPAFNGVMMGGGVAIAGIVLREPLALPWVAFLAVECFALPARIACERLEEGEP